MHPKGERFDRDKEDNEMNDEGKFNWDYFRGFFGDF